jgi:peptidoglycan/LPS O-acetylase OafA/YrhL
VDRGSVLAAYVGRLDAGVAVFFLISGFLLYRPFAAARAAGDTQPHTGAYAWRRFLRIVPAYWLALTAITIWLSLPAVFTLHGVPVFYGFGQIYSASDYAGGIGQAWTLCVEVTFYAFLPLWALAMRRLPAGGSRRAWLTSELVSLALLAVASMAWKIAVVKTQDPNTFGSQPWLMPLPNFLDEFALGMGLAVLSVYYQDAPRLPAPLRLVERAPVVPWLLAAVAFWAVATQVGFNGAVGQPITPTRFVERHVLYAAVAFFLLLPAIFGELGRGVVRQVLGNRVLLYVGLVSYGIYLWHVAVFTQIERWGLDVHGGVGPFLLWGAVGLAGATAVASVSYHVLERPALSLKGLVAPPPRVAPGEAPAEPAPAVPAAPRAG